MDVTTTLKANVITLDVTASRVVGQTIGQNIVQIDRKPAFQEVSKVYGPPGAKGDTGAQGAAGAPGKDGHDGAPGIGAYTASNPVEILGSVIQLNQTFLNQNIYLTDGGDF